MTAPVTPDEPGPVGFDDFDVRLGDVMRGERATLGKSLLDVQRDLKIKAAYIAAIENSDPGAFETPGFVAGYVRSYARYLGMDPDWAFRTFCSEAGFSPTHGVGAGAPKRAEPAATPAEGEEEALFTRPKTPFLPKSQPVFSGIEPGAIGSIMVLLALIGAIGYGGLSVFREVQQVQFTPVDPAPEVVAEADPLAAAFEIARVQEDEAGPTEEALARLYRPQALDVTAMTPRDGPIASLDPAMVGTFSRLADAGQMTAMPTEPERLGREMDTVLGDSIDSAVLTALSELDDGAASTAASEAPPRVMVFAVQPSWIRVRAADGTVLFEKILDAHEEYVIPQTEGVPTLRAGNAGSLYFSIGDRTYGPAGDGPSVIKDVALAPEALSTSYALADPEDDGDLAEYYAVAEARQRNDAPGETRAE